MSDKQARWAAPILGAMVFVFYFFLMQDVAIDYWDTYIAAPATFVSGRPCTFVDEAGDVSYIYDLKHRLPDDLVGRTSFGIVSKDQRIGAGVTFAVAYLAFGMIGFRLLYAGFGLMAFAASVAAGRRLFDREWLAIALGLIVAVNPFMLMMNRLNANFMTVGLTMALLALMLAEKPRWLVIGLAYGAIGGIRNEAIMLGPAILLLVCTRPGWIKHLALFTAGALAGIAPYLAWNKFAFGKALIHASQFSDFDGWRPMFRHEILGWEFEFNGLFNWPFADHLVRTPHYPFPTYLTLPLTLVLCFGTVLSALAIAGLWAQWKADRRVAGACVLWIALCAGLFLFQENWEEPKTTFAALNIPALGVLMAAGIGWLAARPTDWRRWAAVCVCLVAVQVGVRAARSVEVPVDERWYVRFPKAKVESAQTGCLADEQRREWAFFHTDECPSELAEQRAKLTRANLLPNFYYPLRLHAPGEDEAWGKYRPEIFDIWHKIYGE